MFRKIILAIAATAAIGAAALTPTTASAAWHGGWHGGHHWGGGPRFGIGFYAPAYAFAPRCYLVRRWVPTPYGPRLRRVQVCN
jgi:hypothetical protein